MKLLAVETATARLSVAVLDGERVLARADEDAPGAHARLLVPAIDRGAELPSGSGVPPVMGCRERAAAFARAIERIG